jgi:hypothetical protein
MRFMKTIHAVIAAFVSAVVITGASISLSGDAFAQTPPVAQTGITSVGGVPTQMTPVTEFSQSCNNGAGGIVGQSYSTVVCAEASIQLPIPTPQATNYGASITQGGSWQLAVPAATSNERLRFFIENYCSATSEGIGTTESIFFVLAPTQPTGTPMSNNAVELFPCGSYDTSTAIVGQNPIWIYANTTGHLYQVNVWNAQ